uniref:Beta 3-glucosyltransferase a n=1 Tax=Eptatretus burgeri TaxID=7764 RepID=A0A8C4NJW4_EPTBU
PKQVRIANIPRGSSFVQLSVLYIASLDVSTGKLQEQEGKTSAGGESATLTAHQIFFVVQSQRNRHHIEEAENLREDILRQSLGLGQASPEILFLHETEEPAGAWTILPILPRIASTLHGKLAWLFFCTEETLVDLKHLVHLLSQYDHRQEWFLGHPLHDEEATIIHHFAFHEGSTSFLYPDFEAGWALSRVLVDRLSKKWDLTSHDLDFTIDLKHEVALYIWDGGKGIKLTAVPQFCTLNETGKGCATAVNTTFPTCGKPVPVEDIFFAVKTCKKFHHDRVPIVWKTWGPQAKNIEFYSDESDPSIPTITLGVRNTERGHCGKMFAILKRMSSHHELQSIPWLVIVDDDTLISVPRLAALLSCYNTKDPIYLGERYGYGLHTGGGYNYITGGGGIVLNREGLRRLLASGCTCSSDDAPDDMILGMCFHSLGITTIHCPLFHQARPEDYAKGYLAHQIPISFHKHWNTQPLRVYCEWLFADDMSSNVCNSRDEL